MRNYIIYLTVSLCLFLTKAVAQNSFEDRAKTIAEKIEEITKQEKKALKEEVEAINVELDNKTITFQESENKKVEAAQKRATNIETRVAIEEEGLRELIKDKIDGKIDSTQSKFRISFITIGRDGKRAPRRFVDRGLKRTTSQLVFALGVNNLVTDGSIEDSDYRYLGSHFYELGITYNTRLLKDNNLLHAKYGLSIMYNNLRPTDHRFFATNGNQTDLVSNAPNQVANNGNIKDSRFRNVYLVVPVHLEFDFTKKKVTDDKTYFRSQESFKIGIGGYAGVNLKSKQVLKYDDNGSTIRQRTKADFNTSDFIYGLSAYVGYGSTSLYVKYDLNPLFKNNTVDQNNVSLGLRFDLN
ncbi:hypothetical protein [Flavobacterium sp. '19STA2R22 D10 B1']|uniref:hypothetical protein n=1 Tax=Flavobacterium aerium TaxID=3037261 RepID=UPI00278BFC62|nr:hypothetical protein [Flavobacterium sp. '19STA2R22 D10 B1']